MAFFDATKKRLIVTYVMWAMIVAVIVLVKLTPQPWRGIIDAGVVIGLFIGVCSLIYYAVRCVNGVPPAASPDMPHE